MRTIIARLNQFTILSEQVKTELLNNLNKKEVLKGTLLLEQGKTCHYMYFLESGFVRGFYYRDGKDITSWFACENDIVTSLYAFVTKKPSFENIEIMENSILYEISSDKLQKLYLEYPELNLIGRLLTEKYYIELEERVLSMQFQSSKERYQLLSESHPNLLQRASLRHIASYLGISQETLSRIRAKF